MIKKYFILICLILLLLVDTVLAKYQYISPVPDSRLNAINTNIILRYGLPIDKSSFDNSSLLVSGAKSGTHEGDLKLSDDGITIVFNPYKPFLVDEIVTVNLDAKIKTKDGKILEPLSFRFMTSPMDPSKTIGFNNLLSKLKPAVLTNDSLPLPGDFPAINVDLNNTKTPGFIYLANYGGKSPYLIILDSSGKVYKYKVNPYPAFDFKVQPNGLITWAAPYRSHGIWAESVLLVADTNLKNFDLYQCGNGYTADFHEFLLLPNGHAILVAYDPQPVDMSKIINGGNPNATVVGTVIQELDADKNIVFQWRSWDHIPITDTYFDMMGEMVVYMQTNGIFMDFDGNLVVSHRHLSQITKINRSTGEVMWRLGGKSNEFKYIGENENNKPTYFSYQHNVNHLTNGNMIFLDDGNQHVPPISRAVEYKLDEVNKTATLVWDYTHIPYISSQNMGSVQRLDNGNTFICWGFTGIETQQPLISEVTKDKNPVFELSLPLGVASYRATRSPWPIGLPEASIVKYELLNRNTYDFSDTVKKIYTGVVVKFNKLYGFVYNWMQVKRYNWAPLNARFIEPAPMVTPNKVTIETGGIDSLEIEIRFDLSKFPWINDPHKYIVYNRENPSSGIFMPIPTKYDSVNKKLIITTTKVGEFVFGTGIPGITELPQVPILISPYNGQKLSKKLSSVKLIWSTNGNVTASRLQVSGDSTFNSLILIDTVVKATQLTATSAQLGQECFWRVKSLNDAGESQWSNLHSFNFTDPYVVVLSPRNNDVWVRDSSDYIIRWETNITDSLKIELLDKDQSVTLVQDSIFSFTGALIWKIPVTVPTGANYRIRATSIIDPQIQGISEPFTISATVDVNDNFEPTLPYIYNYPNPAIGWTQFQLKILNTGIASIKIYNSLGSNVATVFDDILTAGLYNIFWDSSIVPCGYYYYQFKAKNINCTKSLLVFH